MGDTSELDFTTKLFLKTYPFRKIKNLSLAPPLNKKLSECRVALVTSAGLVSEGDRDFEDIRGGDSSYRLISSEVNVASLREIHRSKSFDHSGVEADRNVAFPLDRLKELAAEGIIKEVAPRHLSFMGSITAPGKLIKYQAPEAVAKLVENQVDIALLIPI